MAKINNQVGVKAPNADQISQFLENQRLEMDLRAQELALQKQHDNHGFEFSKKALDAQLTDRNQQRENALRLQRNVYVLIGGLSILAAAVVVAALWMDKESVAIEIIKTVALLIAGGVGGYGIRGIKESRMTQDQAPPQP
ncbi:hypothetical protein [Desulfonatronum thiodismutans]|uniref:hypothetical protein n=1 Tax=Desulfonatronum thiodismutans TaxID=159290 RepID=UPI0004ABEBE0|nr:hypothetical protein [Desulfonatronum thiodismutans]